MRDKVLFLDGSPQDEKYARYIDARGDAVHPDMAWQSDFLAAAHPPAHYILPGTTGGRSWFPQGKYFVLGDNRDNSEDSRYWGFVGREAIRGHPWLVYLSLVNDDDPGQGWFRRMRWGRVGHRRALNGLRRSGDGVARRTVWPSNSHIWRLGRRRGSPHPSPARTVRMTFPSKRGQFREGSLDQYLKEISAYPLIDRNEEVRLAKEIRKGEEWALDKLVRSNLRFVVSVAKKYQNQGVPLPDLINEGNLGLIRAAHKFDETKGIKFISYAVWWIRQAILQALAEQSRIVRVPLNRAGALHRIGRRSSTLLQELGREPTVDEIAEELEISREEVERTLAISQSHLSLDAPVTPGEDNRLLDYLPDQYSPGPEDEAYERALKETVEEALSTLKEREAKILRLYFGLDDQEPMTLEEIGSLLGITRERVRQIKEKALLRLRHASRARFLETFMH